MKSDLIFFQEQSLIIYVYPEWSLRKLSSMTRWIKIKVRAYVLTRAWMQVRATAVNIAKAHEGAVASFLDSFGEG